MNLAMPQGARVSIPSGRLARASRRGSTRRSVTLACQAVRERDFRLVADRALDLSAEGMLVPMGIAVEQGEVVLVSFEVPGTWIDLEATVSRVVHGRRPHDGEPAVGLAFGAMSAATRAALAGFLHGRPPPLPRRGPLSRLRRGEPAPQLADQAIMAQKLLPRPVLALAMDDDDVEDDVLALDDADVVEDVETGAFGLEVLREMASAWRKLATID